MKLKKPERMTIIRTVRFTPSDNKRIIKLAKQNKLNFSEAVRLLINNEFIIKVNK